MSANPFKVVLFTFWFTILPTIMAFREDSIPVGLATYFTWLLIWAMEMTEYAKRAVKALLIAALLAGQIQPARAEPPQAAAIGVGVVVICVGGYCVYKVVKFCQKKFPPKSTNAPPEEFSAAGDEYGGACEYSSIGSCYTPPDFPLNSFPYEDTARPPTTFTLHVTVGPGAVKASMSAVADDGMAQDWIAFQDEMASHGLLLTGHPSQPQFETGGVPCDPSMVPLEFDAWTGRITQKREGHALRRVSIERSPNLQDWHPMMVTDVSDGTRFQCIDCTRESQMFYRVYSTEVP